MKNNNDYIVQEYLERLRKRSKSPTLSSKGHNHNSENFVLVKGQNPPKKISTELALIEAGCRFLSFCDLLPLLCLSKKSSEYGIKSLKKRALLEEKDLPKQTRLEIWRSYFIPSLSNLTFKDYSGVPLDEDDNIIMLDVKRTYSSNKSFDKEVVFY